MDFEEAQITLETAGRAYQNGVAIITNRLHGALLAAKYDVLPLVLSDIDKHLKIKGIYHDAGLHDLLLEASDTNEAILEKVLTLLENRTQIMEQLAQIEQRYHALTMDSMAKVLNG